MALSSYGPFVQWTFCPVTVLLLGRVAIGAQRSIVVKLSRVRSVGLSVGLSVQCIMENGGSDPDAVWYYRSDGSKVEAGGGVWRSVKGYFWGRIWGAPL